MAKSSGDILFSWGQFWAYFSRKDLDGRLKQEMWKDMRFAQMFDGMSEDGQADVLEFAPDWFFNPNYPHTLEVLKVILPQTWKMIERINPLAPVTKVNLVQRPEQKKKSYSHQQSYQF
jgi:hypothetical protein